MLALGFERVLLFEKDRESWELGKCKVELDTMPVFGLRLSFMRIREDGSV